jgi:hypothetical protein
MIILILKHPISDVKASFVNQPDIAASTLQGKYKLFNYSSCEQAVCPDETECAQNQNDYCNNQGHPVLVFDGRLKKPDTQWYQQETDNDADHSEDVANCFYNIHLTELYLSPLRRAYCSKQVFIGGLLLADCCWRI